MRFGGYAAIWDSPDKTKEIFPRGSLTWKKKPDIRLQHDEDQYLGRILVLREDEIGLWVEGKIKDPYLIHALKLGVMNGLSVGFNPKKQVRKKITAAELVEVSFVLEPCHPMARVQWLRAA